MQPCRFELADCPRPEVDRLRRELGVSDALAQVLVRRGLGEPSAARAFLAGAESHPPRAFAGIGRAVAPILAHVHERSQITIHGDYDVDGVCSTAVLVRALRGLGGSVDHYLPDRASDGYGLNAATIERLAARGTRLLITADCAITAVEEIDAALALGIEVVVSDHHTPRADGRLPRAPIVHPRVCGYPCADLCATAVAHKLAEAVLEAAAAEGQVQPHRLALVGAALAEDLDLVALATIADVVPLVGENRALVRRGLRALARTTKPGLRALMGVAGVDPAKVDERAVGFGLAPRLNAAGRLYRADAGLELILTRDPERAAQVAQELDSANRERRQVELAIRIEAETQMRELGERPAYVLAGEGWHPGVIGIVASRLVEASGRPVVLVSLDGGGGRGSGRSIDAFDLLGGLSACAEHLQRYGGHSAAAGLELARADLSAFADAFCAHAGRVLSATDTIAIERVDAVVGGEELGMTLAEELARLAPFGRGNPGVSLMVAEASFSDARPMGEGKHVRFTVRSRGAQARAVAFGTGGRLPVRDGVPAQATFTLEVNEWNGVSEPRLVLRRAQVTPSAAGVQPALSPQAPQASLTAASAPTAMCAPTAAPAPPATAAALAPAACSQEKDADSDVGELVLFAVP